MSVYEAISILFKGSLFARYQKIEVFWELVNWKITPEYAGVEIGHIQDLDDKAIQALVIRE